MIKEKGPTRVSNSGDDLTHALVQGIVQSAIARGVDPVARLQQFRALQQVSFALSQDPAVARTSERLIHAIDLAMIEPTDVKEWDGPGSWPLASERLN